MPVNMMDRRILMSFPFMAFHLYRPSTAREVLDELSECALLEAIRKLVVPLLSHEFFFQGHQQLDGTERL